jgi:hypothetical protein
VIFLLVLLLVSCDRADYGTVTWLDDSGRAYKCMSHGVYFTPRKDGHCYEVDAHANP